MVRLLMLYKYTLMELESPDREISQCHVNILKKKLFMPYLAFFPQIPLGPV